MKAIEGIYDLQGVFIGITIKKTIFVSKNGFIKYSGCPAA